MKITRKVNGETFTFELNGIELFQAYFECQHENDKATITDFLEYALEDAEIPEESEICNILKNDNYIEKCATDFRTAIRSCSKIYYDDTEEWTLVEEIVKRNYSLFKER